jgi:hypothetical protein
MVVRVPRVPSEIKKAQADTGNKNGRHGHKSNDMACLFENRANDDPLVSAEKPFNVGERGRVYVKGVSINVPDLIHTQVVWDAEAMIHRSSKTERGIVRLHEHVGNNDFVGKLRVFSFVARIRVVAEDFSVVYEYLSNTSEFATVDQKSPAPAKAQLQQAGRVPCAVRGLSANLFLARSSF